MHRYLPHCSCTMVHNGHLLAQSFQIFLGDSQAWRKDVAGNGHHLLQDVLLATHLLHLVEKLHIHHTPHATSNLINFVSQAMNSHSFHNSHPAYHILEYILDALLRILALLRADEQINAL